MSLKEWLFGGPQPQTRIVDNEVQIYLPDRDDWATDPSLTREHQWKQLPERERREAKLEHNRTTMALRAAYESGPVIVDRKAIEEQGVRQPGIGDFLLDVLDMFNPINVIEAMLAPSTEEINREPKPYVDRRTEKEKLQEDYNDYFHGPYTGP